MYRHALAAGLAAALLAATSAVAQSSPFTRTVVVPNTGKATASGAGLLYALQNLTPAPSGANRWVVRLEGGTYSVGNAPVVLQPFVDLIGAGTHTTIVQGIYPPQTTTDGLVQGASNSEIRDLTIKCTSVSKSVSCRALGLLNAHAILTDLNIVSTGDGAGTHWGIRSIDSSPVIDRVTVRVDGAGQDNYGIVFGGSSKLKIWRSQIVVENASNRNVGIAIRDTPGSGTMRDSTVHTADGAVSASVYYLDPDTFAIFSFENVSLRSEGSNKAVGLGVDSAFGLNPGPRILYRHGSIHGTSHGVDHGKANIDLLNSEVHGSVLRVHADKAKIGKSWLRGAGTISAVTSLLCAGTFDDAFAFLPSTCPP